MIGTIGMNVNIAGISFSGNVTETGDGEGHDSTLLPVSYQSSAFTRSDDNTGVATVATGHGFLSADKVDVFWTGGKRTGMDATVATNDITIDGGAGDNLPANGTVLILSHVTTISPTITGNSLLMIAAGCDQRAVIRLQDVSLTTLLEIEIATAGDVYYWKYGGGTNPLAGVVVAKAALSNGSIVTCTPKFGFILTP